MKSMSERKLEALKSMHNIVCLFNDEEAYMRWINLVPDEATEEDLREIAEYEGDDADKDEFYDEIVKLFFRLCKDYGEESGLFFQNYPNSVCYG